MECGPQGNRQQQRQQCHQRRRRFDQLGSTARATARRAPQTVRLTALRERRDRCWTVVDCPSPHTPRAGGSARWPQGLVWSIAGTALYPPRLSPAPASVRLGTDDVPGLRDGARKLGTPLGLCVLGGGGVPSKPPPPLFWVFWIGGSVGARWRPPRAPRRRAGGGDCPQKASVGP